MMYVYFTFEGKDISEPILFTTLEEAQEKMKSDFVNEARKNNRLIDLDEESDEDVVDNTEETDVSENNAEDTTEEDVGNIEENTNHRIYYYIRDNFGECLITDTSAVITNTDDGKKWNANIFPYEE